MAVMSTGVAIASFRFSMESYSSWMMYLPLCAYSPRILLGDLVVVGGLQHARRPAGVALLALVSRPVLVGVDEPVGVGLRVVDHRSAGHFLGIGHNRAVEDLLQALDLFHDALGHVAVAVVVGLRALHAHRAPILSRGDVGVAGLALGQADLQRMRGVAGLAGVVARTCSNLTS
jgi:hypothetical protein